MTKFSKEKHLACVVVDVLCDIPADLLTELEGKDVEDLFTAVLSPSTTQATQAPPQTQGTHTIHGHPGQGLPPTQINSGMSPGTITDSTSRLPDLRTDLLSLEKVNWR